MSSEDGPWNKQPIQVHGMLRPPTFFLLWHVLLLLDLLQEVTVAFTLCNPVLPRLGRGPNSPLDLTPCPPAFDGTANVPSPLLLPG